MDLVISVEEQSTADIQFGLTLSGLGGDPNAFPLSGLVKWDDRDFLGNGTDLSIEANASPPRRLSPSATPTATSSEGCFPGG